MSKETCVLNWSIEDVISWLEEKRYCQHVKILFQNQRIDGRSLLMITEYDLSHFQPLTYIAIGDQKRLYLDIQQIRLDNADLIIERGYDPNSLLPLSKLPCNNTHVNDISEYHRKQSFPVRSELNEPNGVTYVCNNEEQSTRDTSYQSSQSSEDGRASNLKPEITKALIALAYLFVVTWITSLVMVIVHDRVPDMKKYPPLPDIFLDNVPHIPWAFHMCEWTVTLLLLIWIAVLVFHKHRFILVRRFFALCGTVFLLRCITMLITSLSVPGSHLECRPRKISFDIEYFMGSLLTKANIIWRNAGLSIRGVRSCGDYMFSGHSVILTMFNFFITEYTPRDFHHLHIFTWILNMFGIFFILSAHEHYSIDVFIAFYITSRLFLYYHTLANNQSLMQRDSSRTRIWFPLFSFFESSVDGIVPNEFESFNEIIQHIRSPSIELLSKLLSFLTQFFKKFTNYPTPPVTRKKQR